MIFLVEKICNKLTQKIRKEMPEVDDERAEVINYGLQVLLGEIPKNLIIILTSYLLGILRLTFFTILAILPYRYFAGGVHLKTHIGCIVSTHIFYMGTIFISQTVVFNELFIKYIVVSAIWILSVIMITLYAPADTENKPILRKKERKLKRNCSYITMTGTLIVALFIENSVLANILIFGTLAQTIMITRLIYKITNNKYGHEINNKRRDPLQDTQSLLL